MKLESKIQQRFALPHKATVKSNEKLQEHIKTVKRRAEKTSRTIHLRHHYNNFKIPENCTSSSCSRVPRLIPLEDQPPPRRVPVVSRVGFGIGDTRFNFLDGDDLRRNLEFTVVLNLGSVGGTAIRVSLKVFW